MEVRDRRTSHADLVEEVVGLGDLAAGHTEAMFLARSTGPTHWGSLPLQQACHVHANSPQHHLRDTEICIVGQHKASKAVMYISGHVHT